MEITWFGWDSFKVKTSGKTIYFDPVIGEYNEPGDIVLISHSHFDHFNSDILSRIRKPNTVVITSKENQASVKGTGLAPGETWSFDQIHVTACHAYNIIRMRQSGVPFHPKGFGVGWIVESESKKLYHLGDTELVPEMDEIGPIDIMLTPISGYYVMDIDEAVKTVKMIKPKIVIPMHYGVFDLGPGKEASRIELNANPSEFAQKLEGITDVRILKHGGSLTI
jgi:L-ascorbate metabolism protein UlaG (beta-lactamase superfamily)